VGARLYLRLGVTQPPVKVRNNLRAGGVLRVGGKSALSPFARRLPVLRFLTTDSRLPVHLDHRYRSELGEKRRANRRHLSVMLLAHRVEIVERARETVAAVVEPFLEAGEHVVAIDRIGLGLEKRLQLRNCSFVI
jgi:hypothetical protein